METLSTFELEVLRDAVGCRYYELSTRKHANENVIRELMSLRAKISELLDARYSGRGEEL